MAQYYFLVTPKNGNSADIINALLESPFRQGMVSEVYRGDDKGNLLFTTGITSTSREATEEFLNGVNGISYSVPDMEHLRDLAINSKRVRAPIGAAISPQEYSPRLVASFVTPQKGDDPHGHLHSTAPEPPAPSHFDPPCWCKSAK